MTNLMAAFFLFMSSSSCLAMAFLWADEDDDEEEEDEEAPFSGTADFRRFLVGGGGAPVVMKGDNIQCWMMPSNKCKVRTKIQCQPSESDI